MYKDLVPCTTDGTIAGWALPVHPVIHTSPDWLTLGFIIGKPFPIYRGWRWKQSHSSYAGWEVFQTGLLSASSDDRSCCSIRLLLGRGAVVFQSRLHQPGGALRPVTQDARTRAVGVAGCGTAAVIARLRAGGTVTG